MQEIHYIMPIYSTEHDVILSKMGDITIGFALDLPEIFTLSTRDYEMIHQTWTKAIKLLPANSILYKQDWFTKESFKADFKKEHSFLSRSSERFFHERPFLYHECLLFVTIRPAERKMINSITSTILRKHIVPVEIRNNAYPDAFINTVDQFIRVLEDSGLIKTYRLREDDLNELINQYLRLSRDKTIRDISFENGIQVGENHCSLFTMAEPESLPGMCGSRITYEKYSTDHTKFPIGFATPVGQLLDCDHIYSQYIFMSETSAVLQQLEKRKLRLQSLSAYSRENAIAMNATDQFLHEAIADQNLPVKAHFNILAWTKDKTDMQEIRNRCSAALTQMDATPKIETVGAPQIFWAGIPGNAADFPMNECFDTFSTQASCLLNMDSPFFSPFSPAGIRLGDRLSGKPLNVDLSDQPMSRGITTNRNKFILGPSGSGKSFFTNHMLRSYYEQGSHIVLVDVGHSYKGLCDLIGGYYFTYSEQNPISFNPFYIEGKETPDTEKKESIKTLLLALWKKDDQVFTRSEYVALSNALQMYYATNTSFPCFDSFYDFLQTVFVKVLEGEMVKEKDFDVSNFLYVLRPYYKGGEFDYLLNAKENIDLLEQPFIVFELDNIKDHPILFPVVTIIIMEVFISKMRKLNGIRKIILIEEAWKAIAKEGMAEYIKYLFKTVRKYFGEAIVVTQDIEDIIASPIVKNAIINNSDCKILLDQSKYQNKFDQVQELLGLSDKEKTMVLSLNKANEPERKYKEVFISLGGIISKVYRTEVSPEEYFAYTTEANEKLKVDAATQKYGSREKGILSITQND
ncbi:MAG: TraG family conjugative transposon ATPase [Chitinophagaceae bacterium]|nr:MAG: TraG family conjugative transposon ATPase [Chitinophagaceae bacterium]